MHPARLLLAFLLPLLACAQEPQPAAPPAPDPKAQQLVAELLAALKAEGIVYDGKQRTISLPVEMNAPPDPIEYLLIHRRGKKHEAMFVTKARPSVLNGALLLLGLQPGQNATYKEKEPAPTLAEIEQGADPVVVTPPKGMQLWMTVAWKDADGKQHEHCVEDLIIDLTTQKPVVGATWIYLGGRMAPINRNEPPVYVADYEGNLVSACYMSPENHLVTIAHERARDDQNWWLADQCPAPGTAMTLTFHRDKPKLVQEREARLEKEAAGR